MKKLARHCLALLQARSIPGLSAQPNANGQWISLLNGKDLTGWDTYLRQFEGTDQPPLGLNNDPSTAVTVTDGAGLVSGVLVYYRMKLLFLVLLAVLFVSGCHSRRNESVSAATQAADSLIRVRYTSADLKTDSTLFAKPEKLGDLDDNSLSESSGVAASRQNPGYLWTDEDSGNPADIQLINKDGNVAARYTLVGITNRDWEDIAVGPGPIPGKSYVYVAEIGDNRSQYPTKTIYRFPEPALKQSESLVVETISVFDSIKLQLPDGPENAEAILIDPGTLALYVLSKEKNCVLYKASYPQSLTSTTLMERLLIMPFGNVTAAAISPDGSEILIRSYHQLWYFTRQKGESVVDALKRKPRQLPVAEEPQGEAVGWAPDGSGFYTTSERTFFFSQPLYFYRRK